VAFLFPLSFKKTDYGITFNDNRWYTPGRHRNGPVHRAADEDKSEESIIVVDGS
jgi:hypothetical protein